MTDRGCLLELELRFLARGLRRRILPPRLPHHKKRKRKRGGAISTHSCILSKLDELLLHSRNFFSRVIVISAMGMEQTPTPYIYHH